MPLLLIGGAVILIVGFLIASGALKFSASVSKIPSESSVTKSTEPKKPEVQKTDLSQTYTNPENSYSIKYPSSWKTDSLKGNVVIYSTDLEAKSYNEAISGVIVFSAPVSGSLKGAKWETQVEIMKLQLEKDYPAATFTGDNETKVGDLNAHVYNYTYPNGSSTFQAKFFVIIKNDRFYGLMATAIKQRWDKYEPILSQMVQSFRPD